MFNLLEQLVSRDYGEDTWDDLLDEAGLDGAYTRWAATRTPTCPGS